MYSFFKQSCSVSIFDLCKVECYVLNIVRYCIFFFLKKPLAAYQEKDQRMQVAIPLIESECNIMVGCCFKS